VRRPLLPVSFRTLTACLLALTLSLAAAAEPTEGPLLAATGPRPVSVLAEEGPAGQLDERSGSLSEVRANSTDTVPAGQEPTMQELRLLNHDLVGCQWEPWPWLL
jgi:hypothetical protein